MRQRSRTIGPAFCVLLGACAALGRPLQEVAPEINATLYTGPTMIEPGDALDVRFARKSEWNQSVQVRPDGNVSFPAIGEQRVAGLTVPELERALGERYRPVLADAELTVNVSEPAGTETAGRPGVVVIGEVTRPGLLGMRGERLTLVEALGRAGGHLKSTALLANTLLLRRSPLTGLCTAWHIDARTEYWGTAEPVYLQRHDLVFVPNTPIDDIDTWIDQYLNRLLPANVASFAVGIAVGRT